MMDPCHIWTVIYIARSNRTHTPTSPNTALATQNNSHDWSRSHMKRHLQCAEQELRLPRKMTLMIDPAHIWNVIYNAGSNKSHPPTSPNIAPAIQNSSPKSKRNLLKTDEASFALQGRFQHDPSRMRPSCSEHDRTMNSSSRTSPNFSIWRSVYLPKFHQMLRLPRRVTLRHHQRLRLPRKIALQNHQMLRLLQKITLQHHQMLHLARKMALMIDPAHMWNMI